LLQLYDHVIDLSIPSCDAKQVIVYSNFFMLFAVTRPASYSRFPSKPILWYFVFYIRFFSYILSRFYSSLNVERLYCDLVTVDAIFTDNRTPLDVIRLSNEPFSFPFYLQQ
jgi:hypothetical protein